MTFTRCSMDASPSARLKEILMKKHVLALIVLAFCSVSFAGTPGQTEADANQQADTAAQESIAQTSISPFATTSCAYAFISGSSNTYLSYCVTVNGNILQIQTPFGQNMLGANGEGYGICNESPAINYTDYGVSDTGNWKSAVVVSHSSTSVKIARTTADGSWTLTQTITKVPSTFSINVVMALKNNQATAHVAYLVRFADAEPPSTKHITFWAGGLSSALARTLQPDPNHGLQLTNVGIPQFSYWQGFAQGINTGPNACAFAFNEGSYNYYLDDNTSQPGSIEMAYVGTVAAGQTKTVTLSYHGL
jgi:hypothetical protein